MKKETQNIYITSEEKIKGGDGFIVLYMTKYIKLQK
jgi:hypothetical protein